MAMSELPLGEATVHARSGSAWERNNPQPTWQVATMQGLASENNSDEMVECDGCVERQHRSGAVTGMCLLGKVEKGGGDGQYLQAPTPGNPTFSDYSSVGSQRPPFIAPWCVWANGGCPCRPWGAFTLRPVRMRVNPSRGVTRITPSPTAPVLAQLRIVSTAALTVSSSTATST